MYQKIEGKNWRHVWVVSDIHGCYQWLMDALKRRHFNPYEDLLISVGDIIDRGPDCVKCLQLMDEKWFRAVRGNHEQMALDAIENNDFALWMSNGGIWFSALEDKRNALRLLNACRDLPHIIEITCANGLNVIAHADYPAAEYVWNKPVSAQRVLWDRDRLMGFMVGKGQGIQGADHFWFGHTPLDKRYDFNNLHYIDTGAVFDGFLTLVQLQ
ncbi:MULTISPECIES: protein-serine/threonine phosphatase [Enterobacterales]|jgi:serine/threonine protein phosphatase 1|uniref:protein-serine/threonine phosphatase n=1 Tax=Enterobacter TaxID=547 RepID=UPI000B7CB7A9|nr:MULTISPECIES: protein-serine/threonine phosphatase [Enterobacter]BBT91208.1 serine/threonine-protein phosphatase [Enterobacter cloacae]MBS0862605.1 protein-serine/threonine phosphatase [Enterobacter mori]MDU7450421.1 protein-serine/threonine phosphatase [Enterobacter sp.]MEB7565594.1 protein-serine/threonine phosphatase [Enterobacter mori]MEB8197445.1 protein-serine/threonine phosphatase [Enterobacter quasimori]